MCTVVLTQEMKDAKSQGDRYIVQAEVLLKSGVNTLSGGDEQQGRPIAAGGGRRQLS